jgi:hypothetical protein
VISPTGEIESAFFEGKLTIADPYDPSKPTGSTFPPRLVAGHRFEIHKGANFIDKNNTTLVVEGIPPGNPPPQISSNITLNISSNTLGPH